MATIIATVRGMDPIGNLLTFFVPTGSMEPPIACLGGNEGCSEVRSVYARAMQRGTMRGVHVTLVLAPPFRVGTLELNVFQSDVEASGSVEAIAV